MNILVISKLSIPAKDRTLPGWEHLRALGHNVVVEHPEAIPLHPAFSGFKRPDAMIAMGVTIQDEAFLALKRYPNVPLYVFNWDCYSWIWKPGQEGKEQQYHASRGQEYDYVRFGELCRRAKEVWVPSRCTGLQTRQWWGVDHWYVILSSCPWWDYEVDCPDCDGGGMDGRPLRNAGSCVGCNGTGKVSGVKDGGHALCTLRHLPDAWDTVFEECCDELGIPYLRTDHNLSRPDYERAVAECRFLVSHYQEASTGGLTLMEGYRLGKPVLLSDSPWNGGRDYFGDRAAYFKHDSRDDFKYWLTLMMAENTTLNVPGDHKQFIEDTYSDQVMVTHMLERMQA